MTSLRAAVVLLILALTTAAALPPATDSPPLAKTLSGAYAPRQMIQPSSWSAHLDNPDLGLWSRFHLHLDWTVGDVRPGDTTSFALPAELTTLNSTFVVTGRAGATIARAQVRAGSNSAGAPTEVVTFTYTSAARPETTISSQVAVTWNQEVVAPDSEVDLQVATVGQTRQLQATIAPEETDLSSARLYGYWQDSDVEPGAGPLQWRFVTPTGPISATELTLTATPGHRIDCADLRLRALTAFAANGDVTQAHELSTATMATSCRPQQITLTLPPVPAETALMVLVSGFPASSSGLAFELTGQARIDGQQVSLTSKIDRVLSSGFSSGAGATVRTDAATPAGAVTSAVTAETATPWTTGVLTSWWLVLLLASVGLTFWWLLVRAHRRQSCARRP